MSLPSTALPDAFWDHASVQPNQGNVWVGARPVGTSYGMVSCAETRGRLVRLMPRTRVQRKKVMEPAPGSQRAPSARFTRARGGRPLAATSMHRASLNGDIGDHVSDRRRGRQHAPAEVLAMLRHRTLHRLSGGHRAASAAAHARCRGAAQAP